MLWATRLKCCKLYTENLCCIKDRVDPQDRGGEYRSLLGLPGGTSHTSYPLVRAEAEKAGFKLVEGKGNDPDTLGKQIVYVHDTEKVRPGMMGTRLRAIVCALYAHCVSNVVRLSCILYHYIIFEFSSLSIKEKFIINITMTSNHHRMAKPTIYSQTLPSKKAESRALVAPIAFRVTPGSDGLNRNTILAIIMTIRTCTFDYRLESMRSALILIPENPQSQFSRLSICLHVCHV